MKAPLLSAEALQYAQTFIFLSTPEYHDNRLLGLLVENIFFGSGPGLAGRWLKTGSQGEPGLGADWAAAARACLGYTHARCGSHVLALEERQKNEEKGRPHGRMAAWPHGRLAAWPAGRASLTARREAGVVRFLRSGQWFLFQISTCVRHFGQITPE